jgi:hypothetical protein
MQRVLAAALVGAAGAIHLYLWFDYFHVVRVIGVLFLANAGAGVAIAVALLATDTALVALAGLAYAAGTLVAFAVSARWGLFGYRESFWGSWQEGAGVVELAAVLLLAAELARVRARRAAPAATHSTG